MGKKLSQLISYSAKTDPELTQKIELVDKDIKTVIIIIAFHMLRKLEEKLNILSREVEGIKKKTLNKL